MSGTFALCGAGLCALVTILLLKELKKEYTLLVSAAFCLLFLGFLLPKVSAVVDFVKNGAALVQNGYAETILRGLGITWLTSSAGEICRSSGEAGLGGQIETAGRVELIVLSLPLFRQLLDLAIL